MRGALLPAGARLMSLRFKLDGVEIVANENETILQAAERHGIPIPHLCYTDGMGTAVRASSRSRESACSPHHAHAGRPRTWKYSARTTVRAIHNAWYWSCCSRTREARCCTVPTPS